MLIVRQFYHAFFFRNCIFMRAKPRFYGRIVVGAKRNIFFMTIFRVTITDCLTKASDQPLLGALSYLENFGKLRNIAEIFLIVLVEH